MRNGITKSKTDIASFILAMLIVLCCIIMLISLFLPLIKATDDLKDVLEEDDWEIYQIESLDIEGKDLVHISIVKLTRIMNSEEVNTGDEVIGIFFNIFLAFTIVLPIYMIVMVVMKQGISVLMNNILFVIVFASYSKILREMELVSKDAYAWSAGYALYIICIVLIYLASLVLIVLKILKMPLIQHYFEKEQQKFQSNFQMKAAQEQNNSTSTIMRKDLIPNVTAKKVDQGNDPVILQIKQYKELADKGIISEEDYNAKKKQLLGI